MRKLIFFEDGKVATFEGNTKVNITVLDVDGTQLEKVEEVNITNLKGKDVEFLKEKKVKVLEEKLKEKKKLPK